MSTILLIFTPFISWLTLIVIYRIACKTKFVDTCIVDDLPVQDENGKGIVSVNLGLHLGMSFLIAILYTAIWASTGAFESDKFIILSMMTGLMHGLAVAIALTFELSQSKDGFRQAILVLVAHIVFSSLIGALIQTNNKNTGVVDQIVEKFKTSDENSSFVEFKNNKTE